jgi:hypothetical protein
VGAVELARAGILEALTLGDLTYWAILDYILSRSSGNDLVRRVSEAFDCALFTLLREGRIEKVRSGFPLPEERWVYHLRRLD